MEIIDKDKTVKSNSDVYELYLGTFIDNAFTWYSIKKFKDLEEAYKEYKKYVNTQLKYTDEELQQVWDTGRLDIELRQGNKLLNWVGIYSREVKDLTKEEEKEAEEGKVKKEKKDSVDFNTELAKLQEMIKSDDSETISQCEKVLDLVSTKDELSAFREVFVEIEELDRQTAREFYYMIQAKEKRLARIGDSADPKYYLDFHFENSKKYTAGDLEFIEALDIPQEELLFDHIPSEDEVYEKFRSFAERVSEQWQDTDEEVELYFSHIVLKDLNDSIVKEYPDFIYQIKF